MRQSPMRAVNMSLIDRWVSVIAGCLVTGGAFKPRSRRKLRMLIGAEMIRRGVTGHSYAYQALGVRTQPRQPGANVSVPYELGIRVRAAVTIAKPRAVVYQFWSDLQNLPRIMKHLTQVTAAPSGTRSHWVAQGPSGSKVEWDAEIHNQIENELIAWRSLEGSDVDSAGSVRFKDAPGGRGTEVLVHLQYNPPAGLVGATVAKLFGSAPETEIETDLFRLKQYLESGEIATADGQPKGGEESSRQPRREAQAVAQRYRYSPEREEVPA